MEIDITRRISFQTQHLAAVWKEVARQNPSLGGYAPAEDAMLLLFGNEKAIVPTNTWPLTKTDTHRTITCWQALDDFSYIPTGSQKPKSIKPAIIQALLYVLKDFCKQKKPDEVDPDMFIETTLFDPKTLESPSLEPARLFLWAICQMVPLETLS